MRSTFYLESARSDANRRDPFGFGNLLMLYSRLISKLVSSSIMRGSL